VAQLGIPASECLVLEDSLNGIKAGQAVGCYTCAIPSDYTRSEDFSIATLICNSLNDEAIKNFIINT
jgi:putative hydrolase of the HAD superfamily